MKLMVLLLVGVQAMPWYRYRICMPVAIFRLRHSFKRKANISSFLNYQENAKAKSAQDACKCFYGM